MGSTRTALRTSRCKRCFRATFSGVIAICEVADPVLGSEICLCLDLTLCLTRSGSLGVLRINGAGGRRHWSMDDKARIVAETLEPNAIISEVARRYDLRPQQVFAWRREARKQAALAQQESPAFVPAVVTTALPELTPTRPSTAAQARSN
nr:transposase [Mesorhizobium sp. M6A.T.Ce.TU.002.03.1.1]